jgi:RHS repeat-associated protein
MTSSTTLSGSPMPVVYDWDDLQFDAVTSLIYDRARFYDPGTGRALSQDPEGLQGGNSNLYVYVGNDPTNETDPSGMQAQYTGPVTSPELVENRGGLSAQQRQQLLNLQVQLNSMRAANAVDPAVQARYDALVAQLRGTRQGPVLNPTGLLSTDAALSVRQQNIDAITQQIALLNVGQAQAVNKAQNQPQIDRLRMQLHMWQNGTDFAVTAQGRLQATTARGQALQQQLGNFDARYEQIGNMSVAQRFQEVFVKRLLGTEGYRSQLSEAVIANIESFMKPANLAVFTGLFALTAGVSTAFPPAGGVIAGLGYVLLGNEVGEIGGKLAAGLALTLTARTDLDFDRAAASIADALVQGGRNAVALGTGWASGRVLNRLRAIKGASTKLPPLTGNPWPNRSPATLAEELATATRFNVQPIRVTGPESIVGLAGQPVKFVVSEAGELFVIPRGIRDANGLFHEISHTVPTRGAPVLAAGEGTVGQAGTTITGRPYSGHYQPDEESLEIAREAFRRAGITMPRN